MMRYVVILVIAALGYFLFQWLVGNGHILLAWIAACVTNGIAASVWRAVPKNHHG